MLELHFEVGALDPNFEEVRQTTQDNAHEWSLKMAKHVTYREGNHYSQKKDCKFVDNMGAVHTMRFYGVREGTNSTNFHASLASLTIKLSQGNLTTKRDKVLWLLTPSSDIS